MDMLRQIITVASFNFRYLHTRLRGCIIVVTGVAVTIIGLLPLLSALEGLRVAYGEAGDVRNVVIMQKDAFPQRKSEIPLKWLRTISTVPGIARTSDGVLFLDAQIVKTHRIPKKSGELGLANIRGMSAKGIAMVKNFYLLNGRMPRPGTRELLVGLAAQEKFANLSLDDAITLPFGTFTVVGVFRTANTLDGSIIMDTGLLMDTLDRPSYSRVVARLRTPDQFPIFAAAVRSKLPATVLREPDYYGAIFDRLPINAVIVAYTLGALLAAGTIAATLHTMYTAISSREQEIVILQSIGFHETAIAISVVLEAILLSVAGALIGIAIVWWWVEGYPYNGGAEGGVFRMAVTGNLVRLAMIWAIVIAFIGSFFPAVHAVRQMAADR